MRLALFLFATVLVASLPATAADWLKFGQSGRVVTGLAAGEWASTDVVANDDHSAVLSVNGCENFDVFQFDDPDGDGAETIVGTVQMCPGNASTGCAPLPNTTKFSGDDAIYGAGSVYMRIEASGADAGSTDGTRWMVRCSQPSNK